MWPLQRMDSMNKDHCPNDIGVTILTTATPAITNALFVANGVPIRNLSIKTNNIT